MRVLHVVPTLATRTGGPPVAVVNACRALEGAGVRTSIFATDMPVAAAAGARAEATLSLPEGAGALDVRLFPAARPRRLVYSPALSAALDREVATYDIVHVHSLFLFPQFAAYRSAWRRRVPYVVSPRGALDPFLRARGRARKALAGALWQRALLERASALHLTSAAEAGDVADIARGVPRFVVSNALDLEPFAHMPDGTAFRARWLPATPDSRIVLCHGRVARKKGLDVLIRALPILRRRHDATLIIAGPDDDGLTASLRALAEREGVRNAIVFTGMLDREWTLAALAAADVWALPSHGENFGNAAVEALAAGRACVLSPHVSFAAEANAAGAAIVAPNSPDAFAQATAALLAGDAIRADIAARARAFAGRYSLDEVGPRMAAMYESVLRCN